MFINVATIDGIKAEVFHRRNHSTSSFNFYYKFNFTGIIQKIPFFHRNEDFIHFVFDCNGCNYNRKM